MSVPDFESLMLPALRVLAGGTETPIADVRSWVAENENLSDTDLAETLPSGRQTVFANRIGWAVKYMTQAGLVERVRHGVYRMTEAGEQLLQQGRAKIDLGVLSEYPKYLEWRKPRSSARDQEAETTARTASSTPDEVLEQAFRQLRVDLEYEVLDRVSEQDPSFLERVVVDLLIAMGYGGGEPDMGTVTGKSGDGGIDGIVKEDALGLDEIYVQAKKFAVGNTVGASALRDFVGTIDTARANKGVFVTTAKFATGAREIVKMSSKRIILIDGQELARLMVKHGIGVRPQYPDRDYVIKRVDEDYFSE